MSLLLFAEVPWTSRSASSENGLSLELHLVLAPAWTKSPDDKCCIPIACGATPLAALFDMTAKYLQSSKRFCATRIAARAFDLWPNGTLGFADRSERSKGQVQVMSWSVAVPSSSSTAQVLEQVRLEFSDASRAAKRAAEHTARILLAHALRQRNFPHDLVEGLNAWVAVDLDVYIQG
eukprot:TRINITY_DN42179_c0_g1_i1.p1 TRINITY_DN42179_c0_g1~~TRINITY_DN42179_c0_g1_i1.p1  ORF type:complete len:189 (+),score=31.18 TRINITY_DN42179_c0_g1_i1:35-568(+)